jgi:tRNA pseudouridine32 synthase/23S rRNA pseudouridine746 synthase
MMVDFPDLRAVHRLDLDTSGLLVFGISQLAVSELNRQFRERTVLKEYVAEVDGVIADDIGEIDLPISADWENRPRQRIDHESGKDAQTYYEVMSRRDDATRLRLKPKTGRSHQLRIHLAEIGHPILGCDLYAHERALSRSPRLCLHAEILGFEHPRSKERLSYTSPTPF